MRAIEAAKSERQREALEDACRRGTELSHEHWGLLKDMSLVKRSLAGVDEFEDSDTKNRFYRWRDIKAEAERLDNEEDQEITRGAASLHRRRWRRVDDGVASMASGWRQTPSTPSCSGTQAPSVATHTRLMQSYLDASTA